MSNFPETGSFNNNNQSPGTPSLGEGHQFVTYSRTNPPLYNNNNNGSLVPVGSDASETFSTGSLPSNHAASNQVGVPNIHQSNQQQPMDCSVDRSSSSVNLPSHFSVVEGASWSRGGSGNISQPIHQHLQSTNSLDMWGQHPTYTGTASCSTSAFVVGADVNLPSFPQTFPTSNQQPQQQQYTPMQQTVSTTGLTVSSDASANHFGAPPAYHDGSLSLMRGARSRDDPAPSPPHHGISIQSTDYSSSGAFMVNSVSSKHLSYNSGGSHPSATHAFSQSTKNDHNLVLQAHYQQQQQFVTNPAPGYQTFVYTSPQGQHHSNALASGDNGMYDRSSQPSKGTNSTTTGGTASKKRKATGQTCPPYDLPSTLRKLLTQFEHIDCELSEADVAPLLDIEAVLLEAEGIPPSIYPPSLDKVNSAANCSDELQSTANASVVAKPRGAKRNAGTYMDLPLSNTSFVIPLRTARFYAPDFTRVFEIPLHHLHCTQGLINHLVDVSIKGPAASRSRLLICEHVYNSTLKPWLEYVDKEGSSTNTLLQSFRRTTTDVRKSLQDENREKLPEEKEVDFPKAPVRWSKAGDEQPTEVYKYARALAELYGKLNRSTWCPLGSKCPDLHPHFVDRQTVKKVELSSTDSNIIGSSSPDNSCDPSDKALEPNTPVVKKTSTTTMPAFAPHPTLGWSTVHANTHAASAHMCFTSGFEIPIAAPNELCVSEKIPSESVFVTKGALEFFEAILVPSDNSLPPLPPLAHLVISSEASASDTTTTPQQDDAAPNITNATTTTHSQAAVRSVLQHCAHFSKNGICAMGAECLFVHAVGYTCPLQLSAKPSSDNTKAIPTAIAPPAAALRVPSNEESNSRNDAQQQRASRKVPRISSSQPQFVTSVPTTTYYSAPQQAQQQTVYARGVPVFQQPQYPQHSHQPATTPPVNTAMNLTYQNLHNGSFGQQQMSNNRGGSDPAWSYMQQPQSIGTQQQQQQQHFGHHNAPTGITSYGNPFPSMFPTHHAQQQQQQQPSFGGAVGGGVDGAHFGIWPGHPTSRSAHK